MSYEPASPEYITQALAVERAAEEIEAEHKRFVADLRAQGYKVSEIHDEILIEHDDL